jgi:hypothetical protein
LRPPRPSLDPQVVLLFRSVAQHWCVPGEHIAQSFPTHATGHVFKVCHCPMELQVSRTFPEHCGDEPGVHLAPQTLAVTGWTCQVPFGLQVHWAGPLQAVSFGGVHCVPQLPPTIEPVFH